MNCNRCGQDKPEEEFALKRGTKRGRAYACKSCHSEYRKQHYLANKDKYIAKAKAWDAANGYAKYGRYGLTAERFAELLARYDGRCWLCQENDATHVDHDHNCCNHKGSCGKCVRGILCDPCNKMLGFARDRVDILQKGVLYLMNT